MREIQKSEYENGENLLNTNTIKKISNKIKRSNESTYKWILERIPFYIDDNLYYLKFSIDITGEENISEFNIKYYVFDTYKELFNFISLLWTIRDYSMHGLRTPKGNYRDVSFIDDMVFHHALKDYPVTNINFGKSFLFNLMSHLGLVRSTKFIISHKSFVFDDDCKVSLMSSVTFRPEFTAIVMKSIKEIPTHIINQIFMDSARYGKLELFKVAYADSRKDLTRNVMGTNRNIASEAVRDVYNNIGDQMNSKKKTRNYTEILSILLNDKDVLSKLYNTEISIYRRKLQLFMDDMGPVDKTLRYIKNFKVFGK